MREVPEDQMSTQLTVLIAISPYKGYFLERNRHPPCAEACALSETRRI